MTLPLIIEGPTKVPYLVGDGRVLGHVVVTKAQIEEVIDQLAKEIFSEYAPRQQPLILAYITNGAVPFVHQLGVRLMARRFPFENLLFENLSISTYGAGDTAKGSKITLKFKNGALENFDVLIVDDMADRTGTLREALGQLGVAGPRTLEACTLIQRQRPEITTTRPKYLGIIYNGSEWLLGGGLDFRGRGRLLAGEEIIGLTEWGKTYIRGLIAFEI